MAIEKAGEMADKVPLWGRCIVLLKPRSCVCHFR